MAWRSGNDPYRLYNSLDSAYRPLTFRHPCPKCWIIRTVRSPLETGHRDPCSLCNDRGHVEFPLLEPGDPTLPVHPERVRNFIYGCARALHEMEQGNTRPTRSRDPRLAARGRE